MAEDLYGPTYEGDERSYEERKRAIDEQVAILRGQSDADSQADQSEADAAAAEAVVAAEDAAAEEAAAEESGDEGGDGEASGGTVEG